MGTGGLVNWIMLNPSTATDTADDPTIRKCIGFSKRWGYGSLVVTNLFAFRATNPKDLIRCVEANFERAVGKDNLEILKAISDRSDLVVAAWGANLNHIRLRGTDNAVMKFLDKPLHCIGLTKDGHPLHPCMAAYTDSPIPFTRERS
jgi:hypothetical protein